MPDPVTTTALPPLAAWQALVLRLTAFRRAQARFEAPPWWSDLIGYPPDKVTSQPKLGLHQEHGTFAGGQLTLALQSDRIDWVLAPPQPSDTGQLQEGVPSLGVFPEALTLFLKPMF